MSFKPSYTASFGTPEFAPSPMKFPVNSIGRDCLEGLRKEFGIVQTTNVQGIELKREVNIPTSTATAELLIISKLIGFDPLKGNLQEQITISLPNIFRDGTLTLRPLDGNGNGKPQVKYESVVSFDRPSGTNFRYKTDDHDEENVHNAVETAMILASLSEGVPQQVKRRGSYLVIVTDSRYSDADFPNMVHSKMLRLTWNKKENRIEATTVKPTQEAIKKAKVRAEQSLGAISETVALSEEVLLAKKMAIEKSKQIFFLVNLVNHEATS